MSKPLGHWDYKGDPFVVDDYFGFIYLITVSVPDGNPIRYVGKKQFHSYKKTKRDKESNWKSYTSSSKHINELIRNGSVLSYEMIQLFETRGGLSAAECKVQWYLDVLTEKCLLGAIKFIPKEAISDETKTRLDEIYRSGRLLIETKGEETTKT